MLDVTEDVVPASQTTNTCMREIPLNRGTHSMKFGAKVIVPRHCMQPNLAGDPGDHKSPDDVSTSASYPSSTK